MKVSIITLKEFFDVIEEDVKHIINKKTYSEDGFLWCDINMPEFLRLFRYLRGVERIVVIVGEILIKDSSIVKTTFEDYYNKETLRIINYLKSENAGFKVVFSPYIKDNLPDDLKNKLLTNVSSFFIKDGFKVNLKKPDFNVLIFSSGKKFFVGLDFGPLNKPKYRVFNHPRSLRSDICYGILRSFGLTRDFKGCFVDFTSVSPFTIEAVLFLKGIPNRIETVLNNLIEDLNINYSFESDIEVKVCALSLDDRSIYVIRKDSVIIGIDREIEFVSRKNIFDFFEGVQGCNVFVVAQVSNKYQIRVVLDWLGRLKEGCFIVVSDKRFNFNAIIESVENNLLLDVVKRLEVPQGKRKIFARCFRFSRKS